MLEANQTKMSRQSTLKKEIFNINLGQQDYTLKKDPNNSGLSHEMAVQNFACQDLQELWRREVEVQRSSHQHALTLNGNKKNARKVMEQ